MKKNLLKTVVLLIAVSFGACLQSPESSFFRSFSLRKLVAEKRSYAGLVCASLGGGGGGSDGIWSLRATREFHSNKTEIYVCAVEANSADLDETALMARLAQDIEKDISSSGPKIIQRGNPDLSSFYLVYELGNTKGRVQISGKRLPGNQYSLQAKLEENGR